MTELTKREYLELIKNIKEAKRASKKSRAVFAGALKVAHRIQRITPTRRGVNPFLSPYVSLKNHYDRFQFADEALDEIDKKLKKAFLSSKEALSGVSRRDRSRKHRGRNQSRGQNRE